MSILKSILHRWNKDSKSYDTLHPETESAQITDWHSGIMASLVSTTLSTVVSAVTTDSVLGKLIKLLLDASGVKYLIDTNGYVCFGSLFGGFIIQWGHIGIATPGYNSNFQFPITFTNVFAVLSTAQGESKRDEDSQTQMFVFGCSNTEVAIINWYDGTKSHYVIAVGQ